MESASNTGDPWVQSLGQEDPLEKRMATTPVFLPGELSVYLYKHGLVNVYHIQQGIYFDVQIGSDLTEENCVNLAGLFDF